MLLHRFEKDSSDLKNDYELCNQGANYDESLLLSKSRLMSMIIKNFDKRKKYVKKRV